MEDILNSNLPVEEKLEMLAEIIRIQRRQIATLRDHIGTQRSDAQWAEDARNGQQMGQ